MIEMRVYERDCEVVGLRKLLILKTKESSKALRSSINFVACLNGRGGKLINVHLSWRRYRDWMINLLQVLFVIEYLAVAAAWSVLDVLQRADLALGLDIDLLVDYL